MPTHWTVILGLTCDLCGEFLIFEEPSKALALKEARADGWYIEGDVRCPQCREKE